MSIATDHNTSKVKLSNSSVAKGESTRKHLVFTRLKELYPHAKIFLTYSSSWELLVAVILSAQCTDIIVNKVTNNLFKKYTTIEDYCNASITEFETDIKSTGFFHNKAKNILAAAKLIKDKFNNSVPSTMDELLTIPGVARKTANVVLGNAFNHVEGIAVDTHVHRISQRLRLISLDSIGGKKETMFLKKDRNVVDYKKDADANKIESELMKVVPESDWFPITYRIIDHGRSICKAQHPLCSRCPLSDLCPASRV